MSESLTLERHLRNLQLSSDGSDPSRGAIMPSCHMSLNHM
jgi:hypothetical protein